MSDIDTVVVNSLKALDPEWPIREADIPPAPRFMSTRPRRSLRAASIAVISKTRYPENYDSRWSLVDAPTPDATPRAHDHIAIYKRIGMAVPRIKDTERTFQAGTGSHVRRSPARVFFAL